VSAAVAIPKLKVVTISNARKIRHERTQAIMVSIQGPGLVNIVPCRAESSALLLHTVDPTMSNALLVATIPVLPQLVS